MNNIDKLSQFAREAEEPLKASGQKMNEMLRKAASQTNISPDHKQQHEH